MSTSAEHFHHAGDDDDLRGPLLAAAAIALAVAVYLAVARFSEDWGSGVQLLVTGIPAALVLALALREPADAGRSRVWVSTLLGVAFVLAFGALGSLADLLGAGDDDLPSGTVTWVSAVLALGWGFLAITRRSGLAAFLAAAAAVVCVNAFVDFAFSPESTSTFRYVLLVCLAVLVAGAYALAAGDRGRDRDRAASRDRRDGHGEPGYGTALADVAGLTCLVLTGTFATDFVSAAFVGDGSGAGPEIAWGWDVVVLATAAALAAFALLHRVAGPGWIAALLFGAFVLMNAETGESSLLVWPLLLLLVAAALAALALRGGADSGMLSRRRSDHDADRDVPASG